MELLFGFIAGLLTLINPCILPVLPMVLASSLQRQRHGPLLLALGMSLTFVGFGLLVASVGHSIGLTERVLGQTGAVLMIASGLVLLVPGLSQGFVVLATGIGSGAGRQLDDIRHAPGAWPHLLGGMLLGLVWSPCVGPTLGGAIALASQGQNLMWVFAILSGFAAGVSSVVLILGYGGQKAIQAHRLRWLARWSRPLMGLIFVTLGVVILSGTHHLVEAWLINVLPWELQDFSVRF